MQSKRVFLIGYMGAGKSSVGKKMANSFGVPFIDIDSLIVEKHKMSINYFFREYGEETFRDEETKVLKDVISAHNEAIIAVGGGLPCFNDNMTIINKEGVSIYLHRPAKELFARLKNKKEDRPLIKDLSDQELLTFIENQLQEREKFYNQAHLKVGRDEQKLSSLKEILKNKKGNAFM